MNYKYTIPTLFILTSITLTKPATAKSLSCSKEVDEIAQQITVLIDINHKDNGSGTLIKHEGNTYTVLTAFHNFRANPKAQYTIVTPDGQHYSVNGQNVKPLGKGIDLPVVKFDSSTSYRVAKLGNSDVVKYRDNVYVGGFRPKNPSIPITFYNCFDGQVAANATGVTADGGYNLVYSNSTIKGMSGGPVLNQQGELIAIHGRDDEHQDKNIDMSAGVPINTYLRLVHDIPETPKGGKLKADDYLVLANKKYMKRDYKGAIVAYNQAIKINPNYDKAYSNRGNARYYLGDKQGAIADLNQAIKINPNYDQAYQQRGRSRSELGDIEGAIVDETQAIKINPSNADAYFGRGFDRYYLGDKQGAMADYTIAIKINPKYTIAYINRGIVRSALGDKQGAIVDETQAIKINPNSAEAYNNRGVVRSDLGDKQGAISDLQQAANLFQQQGKNEDYQKALNIIRELQQ